MFMLNVPKIIKNALLIYQSCMFFFLFFFKMEKPKQNLTENSEWILGFQKMIFLT